MPSVTVRAGWLWCHHAMADLPATWRHTPYQGEQLWGKGAQSRGMRLDAE